jgi:hypothetical protein
MAGSRAAAEHQETLSEKISGVALGLSSSKGRTAAEVEAKLHGANPYSGKADRERKRQIEMQAGQYMPESNKK